MKPHLPTLLFTSLLAASPAFAQITIASDSFELADHPTGDRTVVTGGANGIRFYTRNATPTDLTVNIANDAGGLGTNVLSLVDTVNTTTLNDSIIGVLSQPVTLAAQGDFIRLEFTFRYTNIGTAAANAGGFRFGIEGSNTSLVTGDNQTSVSDNDQGYYAQTGVGPSPANAPANTNVLFRENGGTFPILGGLDRTGITASSTGVAINNNNAHSVSFTITRGSGTNISLSLAYDGGAPITGAFTGTNFFTFDEIAFSNGFVTSPVSFNIDNVSVVSNVPEPGTMGLMSLGAVGMLGLVRRRTR
jgi:hypothetical protein